MEDEKILELYLRREGVAISESELKYGGFLMKLALNILKSREDAQECVNDALMRAWSSIPPQKPARLGAYLGRLTRNLALDMLDARTAQKRGGGEVSAAIDELEQCVSSPSRVEDEVILADTINGFLASLRPEERRVFLLRYWAMETVGDIARRAKMSESRVTSMLYRTRKKLKKYLEEEKS